MAVEPQDGAHHRRREQGGAFFDLAHGVTSLRAHQQTGPSSVS